ncbi:MmcQ/YjbR family DNA-binding protein [Anaerocolumna xylanovorans]|uniref:Predicted DNA-binding protein, MmcQ/YjbR family n=1 Tax=Anaerocolumna xylanovorans DSM 12503 TaxID=1121345 RepID=A0A1M7YKY6_9FIRM|nr:MmcQ/YjbR family DNA-binding protein [Anaerocolumna xylanovorans]SHO53254.1 Predicted DNA-binding protein, MmcQ/YjbR family [Anaerocolumna xylanovorans DSM 12503]
MNVEEIKQYCMGKENAYEDYPFGDIPICYRLNGGGIFAQVYPLEGDYKITLRCETEYGQFFRTAFPDIVVKGYHCPKMQQPYFNTVYLNDFEDSNLLLDMIDHSYNEVLKRLSKKKR